MNANPDLVASVLTALVSLVLGVLSFIGASRAGHHDDSGDSPDAAALAEEALTRAAATLTDALARCQEENDRLRSELGRG